MLGTGALGQLALGQENTARMVALAAKAAVTVRAPSKVYAAAALGASSSVKTGAKLTAPVLTISARGAVAARMLVPAGIGLLASSQVNVIGRILTGVSIMATVSVRVSTFTQPEFRNTGAGKKPGFPSYAPQPAYEVKPAKPFRPIWDIQREIEQRKDEPKAEIEKAAIPLPPASLFGTPEVTVNLTSLPDHGALVPGDWHDIGVRASAALDQRDVDDAMAVLERIADEALLAAVQSASGNQQ